MFLEKSAVAVLTKKGGLVGESSQYFLGKKQITAKPNQQWGQKMRDRLQIFIWLNQQILMWVMKEGGEPGW